MNIILAYHYPCLDGAYSLLMAFLYIKFYIEKTQKSISHLIEGILDYLKGKDDKMQMVSDGSIAGDEKAADEKAVNKEELAMIEMEEEKVNDKLDKDSIMVDFFSEETKSLLMSTDIANLFYLPIKLEQDPKNFISKFSKFSQLCNDSLLILMDTFGQSSQNIAWMCNKFKEVLILDHHISFMEQFSGMKEKPKNLNFLFDEKKAGVGVVYKFLDSLKPQITELVPAGLLAKTLSMSVLIEDYDIKSKKFPETEAIAAAIFYLKIELNINTNPCLFKSLLQYDIEFLTKVGEPLIKERKDTIEKLLKTRKIIKIGGAKGYALKCNKSPLINDLGLSLAVLSLKDGLDNFGLVYKEKEFSSDYKVSVRGNPDDNKEGICHKLAALYKGGGHPNAAGFFIKKAELKKLMMS